MLHGLSALGGHGAGKGHGKCGGDGVLNRMAGKANPEMTHLQRHTSQSLPSSCSPWGISPGTHPAHPALSLPLHVPPARVTSQQRAPPSTFNCSYQRPGSPLDPPPSCPSPHPPSGPGCQRCSLPSCWSCWLSSLSAWAEDSNLGGRAISRNGGPNATLITGTDLPAAVGGSNVRGCGCALRSANLPPLLY